MRPDVIVAVTTTAALAAKRATSEVPIVALGPADPVKSGRIASLARPGGNLTGVSPNQAEIAGKWLELLREILPRAKSLAYFTDTGNPGEMLVFRDLESRARALGMTAEALDGATAANGDKPADLPFEMAASFKLVLDLRAARELGIAVPQAVRIRADEVIE